MAKGSGPIQYNELFASDVESGLQELLTLSQVLDQTFQSLSKTILNSKTRISISIKEQNGELTKTAATLDQVDVAAKGAGETLTRLAKTVSENSKQTKSLTETQDGLNDTFNVTTASVDEIKTRIKQLTAEYNGLKRGTDGYTTSMDNLDKEVKMLNKDLVALTGGFGKVDKSLKISEDSARAASIRLTELRRTLDELPGSYDRNTGALNKANPAVAGLLKEINLLDAGLKKYDADLGRYGRSVGNYAGAFSPLGNSINQISRELPALAINFQTFALALSNNLPIAADAIGQVNAQNKILKAEGQPTTSVLKQIVSGIFSWQTLLSVGIAVFTIYSGKIAEWFTSITKGVKGIDMLKEKTQNLNDVFKNANAQAGSEITRLELLAKGVNNLTNSEETRLSFAKELQKIAPKTFGNLTTEAILTQDLTKYINLETEAIIKQAKAKAAEAKISELQSKILDAEFQKQKIRSAGNQELRNVRGEIVVSEAQSGAPRIAISEKAQRESIRGRAKEAIDAIDGQTEALKRQQDFLKKYIDSGTLLQVITDPDAGKSGAGSGGGSEKGLNALDQLRERIDQLTLSLQLQALAQIDSIIGGKGAKIDPKLLEDLRKLEDQLNRITNLTAGDINGTTDLLQAGSVGLGNSGGVLGSGNVVPINLVGSAPKSPDDLKNSVAESLDLMRLNLRVIGDLFGQEFANLFGELTDNLQNFLDETGNSFEDWAQTGIAAIRALNESYQQGTALRIEALQLEKQAQVDIAGTNKEARLNIEKEYNDRIRQEKTKQARLDKQAAIFEIGINTAIAASKVTAQTGLLGIPLIPIIIALGVAQIAAVLARPIPQFRHGRNGGPATVAEVNEDGPEALVYNGQVRFANQGKRGLTYLRENEKVLTAPMTSKVFQMQELERNTDLHGRLTNRLIEAKHNDQVKTMAAAFFASRIDPKEIGDAVGDKIAKLPLHSSHFTEDGVKHFVRKGNTTTEIINKRYSL